MAAPCRKMASCTLWKVLSHFRRPGVRSEGCRQFSMTSVSKGTVRAKHETVKASSPWTMMAAVCLQRFPVISADPSPMEQRFKDMLQQVCLEINNLYIPLKILTLICAYWRWTEGTKTVPKVCCLLCGRCQTPSHC